MPNLNKVFLIGNLTRDPELRYTPSGSPVCEFGLAINRVFSTREGERREEVCFVDVTAWAKQATTISEYMRKGRLIFVEGRLKYDSWETPDGRRSKLRVVVENFQFLGGRDDREGAAAPPAERPERAAPRGERPSAERGQRPEGAEAPPHEESQDTDRLDVSDDEIPF